MRRLLVWLATAIVLTGCVPASPDVGTYDDKARLTLQSGVSETRTVQKVLETLRDGRVFKTSAKTQLRYSEDAIDTATKAFTELNPPPTRDWLYKRTGSLMSDAGDLLTRARIAVERDRIEQYPAIAKDLSKLASSMEKLEGRLS